MMTREEAIEYFESLLKRFEEMYETETSYWGKAHTETTIEATRVALSALRPVSREQVEKVFSGCDFCKIELNDYPYIVAHSDYSSSDTCYEPSFCPICGKPLTDEAVQMVMERVEEIKNG